MQPAPLKLATVMQWIPLDIAISFCYLERTQANLNGFASNFFKISVLNLSTLRLGAANCVLLLLETCPSLPVSGLKKPIFASEKC